MNSNPIEKACVLAGGKSLLARALGVSPPTVHQWANGARPVPVEFCVAIERETGGQVTRPDLRPNDWHKIWPELHAVYPSLLSLMTSKRRRNSLHAARAAAE